MKVLMLNGSRKERGCTYTALSLVGESLAKAGVETEIVHIGVDVLKGKVDTLVKEVGEKGALADGLVIGSPVYYAGPSGEIKAFLDRLFSGYAEAFRYKPGAAVTSARRAGTTGPQHGLAAQEHRGRQAKRRRATCQAREAEHELHPLVALLVRGAVGIVSFY